jgi:hypothetical protein
MPGSAREPERRRPTAIGRTLTDGPWRERYGLGPFVVIGFIGTFGPWHGAEMLARAFVRLSTRSRERRRVSAADDRRRRGGWPSGRSLEGRRGIVGPTGLVPQEHGPEHLAACDIRVAARGNADGTPFFGSPTAVHMAMGKGIVASNPAIGEVLGTANRLARSPATSMRSPPAYEN